MNRYIPSSRFPVGLKWLLIANVTIFVIASVLSHSELGAYFGYLALVPRNVVHSYALWELVTYTFIHRGIGDILWNMLALWMFGAELERLWGTRRFLRFYFLCGILAGIAVLICAKYGGMNVPTLGSGGAVCGILVAYGLMFPDQTILFSFLIPMKSKYFVMIIGGIIFLQAYLAGAPGIAMGAQLLGGLLAGFLLLRGRKLHTQVQQPILAGYKEWKLRRAKRKFEVYLRKQDSNRDRWVH
ncbi:MAG: rhomboid family intramembrane serine protease [Acidobacteriaceae bacterium]|nr:rhomboid family intramembrane serine protease [Acidobacteriaceae bacterium]